MTVFVLVLASFVLMTLVSGVYLFVFGCTRRKELPWLVETEIKKTHYGKFCGHIRRADQWLRTHNAQDVWIKSTDGLRLHGLWIPVDNARGTIIFAHGYRSCPLLDFGLAFSYYYNMRLNLLIPDQRAHGKSEGRFITFGVKESKDIQSWIHYHNTRNSDTPIILSGLSMGASTMLYLADRKLPQNVKGIIADCGFTSPHEILSSVFKDVTHLPAYPSIFVAEFCARCFAGFSLWDCDTRKSLANASVPVLLIHGQEDGFVPWQMSKQCYDVCTSKKQLLLVKNADHGVSFLVEPERYSQLITTFVEENIR